MFCPIEIKGKLIVCGMEVPIIHGGFHPQKKAMLVRDIAMIHKKRPYKVNELINENRHRFRDFVDVIDLKPYESSVILLRDNGILSQQSINRSTNIYLVSERGYAKLIKLFHDDLSWERYDQLLDEYFYLRDYYSFHSATQIENTPIQNVTPPQPSPAELILQLAQQLVHQEKQVQMQEQRISQNEEKVIQISKFLTEKPTREKINRYVIEYSRHLGHRNINLAWHDVYRILKAKYGIDIPLRVERARARLQRDRIAEGKCPYSMKTLEKKVNGLDIVFKEGLQEEVLRIVTGLINQSLGGRKIGITEYCKDCRRKWHRV